MGTAELHQGSNESPAPSPRPPSVSKEEESGKNEEITKDIDIVSSNRLWGEEQRRFFVFLEEAGRFWEERQRRLLGFLEEEGGIVVEDVRQYRYRKMEEEHGGGFWMFLKSIYAEKDFIKLLEDLKMNRVEAKLVKVYIDGRLHSLANDGITLLIVCGIQIMMDSKRKETLRKNRKLTSKEDAYGNAEKEESFTEETSNTSMNKEDLDNSKKSVEVEKEINVKGTFSASMKNEDHEKSMKSAEVENEDNFKEKGTSTTSMNKEDHGNIMKSVEVGKEDNIKGTFSTSMKEKDCENNMKSVEVVKEDTFDEKGLSSTSMNKEDRKDRNQSKKSTEVENEDNVKVKGTSSTRMNKEGEEKLEYRRCIICLSADLCMVFFPCRHVVACEACSDRLKTCAVCRALIRGSVKVN